MICPLCQKQMKRIKAGPANQNRFKKYTKKRWVTTAIAKYIHPLDPLKRRRYKVIKRPDRYEMVFRCDEPGCHNNAIGIVGKSKSEVQTRLNRWRRKWVTAQTSQGS